MKRMLYLYIVAVYLAGHAHQPVVVAYPRVNLLVCERPLGPMTLGK